MTGNGVPDVDVTTTMHDGVEGLWKVFEYQFIMASIASVVIALSSGEKGKMGRNEGGGTYYDGQG